MNISKISRSLVIAVFVAFIIFLGFLNISLLLNKTYSTSSISDNLMKIGYAVAIIMLVLIYVYIKDKFYKKRMKRSVSLIYRYIYLVLAVVLTSIVSNNNTILNYSSKSITIYLITSIITSLVIKKIIFNVSKSDILSVFGMFMYSFLPNIILDKNIHINSMIITLSFFTTILVLQILIDELKQKGMKTKKYLIESIILGILVGINIFLGINFLVWILVIIGMIFTTIDLDKTHITFPKKIMTNITKEKREALYKIERININKLIVSIVTSCLFALLIYKIGSNIVSNIDIDKLNTQTFINLIQNIKSNKISNIDINILNIIDYGKNLISFSKTYYMVIFIYILCLELLAFMLKRRYDTKSTIMKIIFITIFIVIASLNLNILYYQQMLTVLLIVICIVNTSNIYLNREERIKMLVA